MLSQALSECPDEVGGEAVVGIGLRVLGVAGATWSHDFEYCPLLMWENFHDTCPSLTYAMTFSRSFIG